MIKGQLSVGFIIEIAIAIAMFVSTALTLAGMSSSASHAFNDARAYYSESVSQLNASLGIYSKYGIFLR